MPARAFTTYRSAGPVLPEFLSNLKNLFKVAYIYLYQGCAARIQNSENFIILKGGLLYKLYNLFSGTICVVSKCNNSSKKCPK